MNPYPSFSFFDDLAISNYVSKVFVDKLLRNHQQLHHVRIDANDVHAHIVRQAMVWHRRVVRVPHPIDIRAAVAVQRVGLKDKNSDEMIKYWMTFRSSSNALCYV